MKIENRSNDALEVFYEAQLLIATEFILHKIGLPNRTVKQLLNTMSKEEMQEFLDSYA